MRSPIARSRHLFTATCPFSIVPPLCLFEDIVRGSFPRLCLSLVFTRKGDGLVLWMFDSRSCSLFPSGAFRSNQLGRNVFCSKTGLEMLTATPLDSFVRDRTAYLIFSTSSSCILPLGMSTRFCSITFFGRCRFLCAVPATTSPSSIACLKSPLPHQGRPFLHFNSLCLSSAPPQIQPSKIHDKFPF